MSITPEVLFIGINPKDIPWTEQLLEKCTVREMAVDAEKILEPFTPAPHIIICGENTNGLPLIEVAQSLRMNYIDVPVFLLCQSRANFDRNLYIKNGFTEAFITSVDMDYFQLLMKEALAKASKGQIRAFKPVKLVDIEAGTTLSFETAIFLPANNKHITFSSAGQPIEKERLERLKKYQKNSILVPAEQISQFYDYSAKRLKEIGESTTLSETEKREKLKTSVRTLFGNMFSAKENTFEDGKRLLQDTQEIVKSYVGSTQAGQWFTKLTSAVTEMGESFNNATSISTYCALFSMALGIGKPEEMALAGLLHDIGKVDVPKDILLKSSMERTPEEKLAYQKYPELTVNMIKSRKIIVSEQVVKTIMQHQEQFGGKGFPKALSGDLICKEAQVLSIAIHFQELTTAKADKKALTPPEALALMNETSKTADIKSLVYDPKLINELHQLFLADSQKQSQVA